MRSAPRSRPYARRVHRVMDYVRTHLADTLSLDDLARIAHFSPFHFHRIFKATTGQTLTAFVQRARLERATYLMKASPDRPLGSIALEVGFSAQSDFSRVFRRHFNMPPSAWDRKSRLHAPLTPDYDQALQHARASAPTPVARVVEHPACRLAYIRLRSPFQGDVLQTGYARLTAWLDGRGVDWRASQLLGLSWDNYETTPLDQVRFDLGFTVDSSILPHSKADDTADDEIGIHLFPSVRAVDVHCRGSLSLIALAWDYLYDEWLPNSLYEPDDMPGIKRFRTRPDELGWDIWDVDCSIALRPIQP